MSEKELLASSTQLYVRFERIAKVLVKNRGDFKKVSLGLTQDFFPMLLNFFHWFDAWKRPDLKSMARRLVSALDGLYDTKDSVADSSDHQYVQLRLAVEDHIGMLRTRLIELEGLSAIIRYDEKRRQKMADRARMAVNEGLLELVSRGSTVSVEQLAHEVHLNPLFKLDDCQISSDFENGVFGRVSFFVVVVLCFV